MSYLFECDDYSQLVLYPSYSPKRVTGFGFNYGPVGPVERYYIFCVVRLISRLCGNEFYYYDSEKVSVNESFEIVEKHLEPSELHELSVIRQELIALEKKWIELIALEKNQIESKFNQFDLMKRGGVHLGAAREYLLWNVIRGDTLEWGSNEIVELTVKQIEELSCIVAAKVLNNLDKYK